MARGFLRVKVTVNTIKPLTASCWLPREQYKHTQIEFRYERLQDFCYRCGRIRHTDTECSFEPNKGGAAGYGEWTKTVSIHDIQEAPRTTTINPNERRLAGVVRLVVKDDSQQRVRNMDANMRLEKAGHVRRPNDQEEAHSTKNVQRTGQSESIRSMGKVR